MENVVHKIYHLTFPCGKDYVGSTLQPFNCRYGTYRYDAKRSKSPICQISTQYKFKEVSMIEVDRIECPKYDSKIKILEEEWKKKLKPTLNVHKAYQTREERVVQIKEYRECNKEYNKEYNRKYSKTPKGKSYSPINVAKQQIILYTKQNRPDMILKWEGILKERIQNRLDYQPS